MALVQFIRGTREQYNTLLANDAKKEALKNSVYFITDEHSIMMNETQYGGVDLTVLNGFIKDVDVEGNTLTFKKDVDGQWTDVSIKLLEAADKSIVLGDIVNGKVKDGSTIKVNVKDVADEDGLKLGNDGLYVDLTKTSAAITKEVSDRKDAINGLNAAEVGGDGKFIKSVKEEAGVVTAVAADLNAEAVAYDKTDDKVIAKATTVSAAIKELDAKVAANKDAELTYETVKLSDEEVTALADANVKEAYQLVSVDKNKTKTKVGEVIKIYKDSALKSIDFTETGKDGKTKGQYLKYVYTLADGEEETVYVDMSSLVDQAEVENGIQASNGKLSIKLNTTGADPYLTVDADGLKLSGVKTAIDTAQKTVQDNLDTEATTARAAEKKNADAITKLNSDAKTEGSVAKAVADAKNSLLGDAADEYNTLGKLEDKIQELDDKATKAHTEVTAKATGHVTVTVADSTDKTHKVVTVAENDIASAGDLSTETTERKSEITRVEGLVTTEQTRAKAAEEKALTDAKAYINNALSWIDAGDYAK